MLLDAKDHTQEAITEARRVVVSQAQSAFETGSLTSLKLAWCFKWVPQHPVFFHLDSGDQTQVLILTRQTLYILSHVPSDFSAFQFWVVASILCRELLHSSLSHCCPTAASCLVSLCLLCLLRTPVILALRSAGVRYNLHPVSIYKAVFLAKDMFTGT